MSPRKPATRATSKKVLAAQGVSAITSTLEQCYQALKTWWPELPPVAFTVFFERQRAVRGYYWPAQWRRKEKDGHAEIDELHIDSTILNDSPDQVLRTLLHEAAHALARVRNIQDTSREGRYHNKKFAQLATELGLVLGHSPRLGITTPEVHPEQLAGRYAPLVARIAQVSQLLWQEDFLSGGNNGQTGVNSPPPAGPPTQKGRQIKAVCGCDPPRIIRVARATLEAGDIECALCGQSFAAPDNDA